jgi:hypothetical protein
MPQSKKRQHHPYQKPAAIPARQRTKGTTLMMILFGIFGLFIAYFASGTSAALVAGAFIGIAVGYFVGKAMQSDAAAK